MIANDDFINCILDSRTALTTLNRAVNGLNGLSCQEESISEANIP